MGSSELTEWAVYLSQIEPLESRRADWRFANLLSTLINVIRGSELTRAADFLPIFSPQPATEGQESDESQKKRSDMLLEKVSAINKALGGRDLRCEAKIDGTAIGGDIGHTR